MRLQIPAFIGFCFIASAAVALPVPARADAVETHLSIKHKMFVPPELDVPANQKIRVVVTNEDNDDAEFESFKLNREKVVPAHSAVPVYVGPLDSGTYPFFNDFDPNKAKGKIVAK
ncbi:MAG TPA: cupredoxin domain-containing protein [Alphaproteobacteria bacterium]|nr:cupredoxin domain-containing protein [Alphaproteobacteria bacterium]